MMLTYLKDLEYIDFNWIMGDIDGYQKFVGMKILPKGIDYVENSKLMSKLEKLQKQLRNKR